MRTTTPAPASLLTPAEVAVRLAVSIKTIYRLVERGELAHIRIVRSIRVHPDALAAYIEASTVESLWIAEELGRNEERLAGRS